MARFERRESQVHAWSTSRSGGPISAVSARGSSVQAEGGAGDKKKTGAEMQGRRRGAGAGCVAALVAVAAWCGVAAASDASDYVRSFEPVYSLVPPYFEDIPFWSQGGSTTPKESVLRLTEDAQHTRGWLWSSVPADLGDAWEVDLKFRVHGRGEKFFGDGLAFWYAKDTGVPGSIHGNQDRWTGLGVFFDTYDNDDKRHAHKHPFAHPVANDGSLTYLQALEDPRHSVGCHAEFRDRFVDTRDNLARITYVRGTLSMRIQLRQGEWQECFTTSGLELPAGYHFGVTASTGDLSDAHDVVSIEVFKVHDAAHADAAKQEAEAARAAATQEPAEIADDPPKTVEPEQQAQDVGAGSGAEEEDLPTAEEMEEINRILKRTSVVKVLKQQNQHHAESLRAMHDRLEGQLQSFNSHIVAILEQLQEQETKMQERIDRAEEALNQQVEQVHEVATQNSRSWMLPFFIIALLLAAGFAVGFVQYKKAAKRHLL